MADRKEEFKLIRMNVVGATGIKWLWYPDTSLENSRSYTAAPATENNGGTGNGRREN